MKGTARFLLLVMLLLTACSAVDGKAASAPTSAPTATVNSTATATASLLPSATDTATSPVPTATVSPAPNGTSSPAASPRFTFTPFPSASPTGVPLSTQAIVVGPTPTPGGPATATPAPAKSLLDQYLPRKVKVAETAHFIFYAQDGYFPVDQVWLASQAEAAYAYVSSRLDNAQVKHKISLAFQPPNKESCPIRGLAAQGGGAQGGGTQGGGAQEGGPMIILFADQTSSQAYLLAVLSHEVGHAISYEGFPEGLPGNIALAEGIATWGSGKYWAAWKNVASLDDLVRSYLQNGSYEAIHENTDLHGVYPWQNNKVPSQDCLARRDKVYSEWADFVGYLIDTYGWPKAHQLFKNPTSLQPPGKRIEFPSDYRGIYGKELNQLEWEWLKWLSVDRSLTPSLTSLACSAYTHPA
jgi:hypothetical protein